MTQLYELALGFNPREAAASASAGIGAALRNLLRKVRPLLQRLWTRKVAIVGLTENAGRVLQKLHEQRNGSVSLLGVFDDRAGRRPASLRWVKVGGRIDDLIDYVRAHSAAMIILALPPSATGRINEILARLRSLPVDIVGTADEANASYHPDRYAFVAGERVTVLVERPIHWWGAIMKRLFDIVVAVGVLIGTAPLLLLVALLIVLDSPGGVLFRQQRIGFNNRPFSILKFRTMVMDAQDQEGYLGTQQRDPRVTRVGHVLRRFSIDELPQLLNVLAGSMSIVGPRPQATTMRIGDRRYADAVVQYIERHKVKPGLTGLAQVSGSRSGIYTLEKAAWAVSKDLEYIENWSLWLDARIVWKTVDLVLSGRRGPLNTGRYWAAEALSAAGFTEFVPTP